MSIITQPYLKTKDFFLFFFHFFGYFCGFSYVLLIKSSTLNIIKTQPPTTDDATKSTYGAENFSFKNRPPFSFFKKIIKIPFKTLAIILAADYNISRQAKRVLTLSK